MSQLWPVLFGAMLAIGGGYLAARWQGAQQRASILHEARIALYVDVLAECRALRDWLGWMTEDYDTGEHNRRPVPSRPLLLPERVRLLAPPRTKTMWIALEVTREELRWELEALGWPTGEGDSVPDDLRERLRVLEMVGALESAVHADLAGVPWRASWRARLRSRVAGLRTRA